MLIETPEGKRSIDDDEVVVLSTTYATSKGARPTPTPLSTSRPAKS
jgi:hypothetical protein